MANDKSNCSRDGEFFDPFLTIAIPAFNEVSRVSSCMDQLTAVSSDWPWACEIIVVDDGSTDGTAEALRKWFAANGAANVQLCIHLENRGKGAAIRTTLSRAKGQWMIIQDADLEYDPSDIQRLLAHAQTSGAEVVYGSRCLPGSGNQRRYNLFALGVSLLNVAVAVLYRQRLTDEATCYKLFRTDDLRRMELKCERFEFCPEVTAKACRLGLRIDELPIRYQPRGHSQGKKITFADGWVALKTLWRYRKWSPAALAPPAGTAEP